MADPDIFRYLAAKNSYYGTVIHQLRDTSESNLTNLQGMCGTISRMLQCYFNEHYPDLEIICASAADEYSVCHIYNLVRDGAGKIWLLDGSAAQFFGRPCSIFDGRPYFVGARAELKEKVLGLMPGTLKFLSEKFQSANLRSLDDVDNLGYSQLRVEIHRALEKWRQPALITERLGAGWETTWGDKSRCQMPLNLDKAWATEVDLSPPRVKVFIPG